MDVLADEGVRIDGEQDAQPVVRGDQGDGRVTGQRRLDTVEGVAGDGVDRDGLGGRHGGLHLARPLGPAPIGAQPSTAPLNVVIQPQVRATIPPCCCCCCSALTT